MGVKSIPTAFASGNWSPTSNAQIPVLVRISTIHCGFSTGAKNDFSSNMRRVALYTRSILFPDVTKRFGV